MQKKYFFKKKIICTAVSKKKKITFYLGLQKFQLISFDPTNGKINYSINTNSEIIEISHSNNYNLLILLTRKGIFIINEKFKETQEIFTIRHRHLDNSIFYKKLSLNKIKVLQKKYNIYNLCIGTNLGHLVILYLDNFTNKTIIKKCFYESIRTLDILNNKLYLTISFNLTYKIWKLISYSTDIKLISNIINPNRGLIMTRFLNKENTLIVLDYKNKLRILKDYNFNFCQFKLQVS
mmetsp:Transcript_24691/g.41484  ORF Transcript_24691/g.41484 Transcript_24691/m.41484 type:complete len:236 (-) Transcript_24691:252-959(-)